MSTLVTRWLVRWSVVRAIAIVLTGRMTGLEARLEVLRRIKTMDLPELLDTQAKLDAMVRRYEERAAPPSTTPT